MALKATVSGVDRDKTSNRDERREAFGKVEGFHNDDELGVGLSDELIMVLMPRVAWDAFQTLAKKYNGSAAEAMSTALKLLEKRLEEVERGT